MFLQRTDNGSSAAIAVKWQDLQISGLDSGFYKGQVGELGWSGHIFPFI